MFQRKRSVSFGGYGWWVPSPPSLPASLALLEPVSASLAPVGAGVTGAVPSGTALPRQRQPERAGVGEDLPAPCPSKPGTAAPVSSPRALRGRWERGQRPGAPVGTAAAAPRLSRCFPAACSSRTQTAMLAAALGTLACAARSLLVQGRFPAPPGVIPSLSVLSRAAACAPSSAGLFAPVSSP